MSRRFRHKKRGTTYVLLHSGAEVQVSSDEPLKEGEMVEVYQSDGTGVVYVRRTSEFHDGRFDELHGNRR